MSLNTASDRLTLILSLVPYLIEMDEVSVADAAAHFRVDENSIRTAVAMIATSGVPTTGEIAFSYDMFDIDWDAFEDDDHIRLTQHVVIDDTPRFSRTELTALIAGLNYLAGLPRNLDNSSITRLQRKLALTASGENVEGIAVEQAHISADALLIANAVDQGKALRFTYTSSDGRSESREVDPIHVESENEHWYLRGWCHSRNALRTFRLERMSDLEVSERDISFAPSTVEVPDSLFDESSTDFDVTLEVERSALSLLGDFLRSARIPAQGDIVRVDVRVAHIHSLKRIVAAYPGVIRVISPPSAVDAIADWAHQGAAQYPSYSD